MDRYGHGRHVWSSHGAAAQLLADEMTREEAWWTAARCGQVAYPALVWADRDPAPPAGGGVGRTAVAAARARGLPEND